MSELAKQFAQFGFAALMCGALLWFIVKMMADHRHERKEWRDESNVRTDRLTESLRSLENVIRDSHKQ